ncbi:MAG: 50S ribosomal protein L37ae [Candidatus Bathyarchaeota archaeon]|nr:MAG: 50S ribosomal protein L37ae [Candidatus Bathyarchaeota archaeon]
MGRTKKIGPTGGLKARYGATVRKRYIEVVTETKRRRRCPQCHMRSIKRQSVGLWRCNKCGLVFTGGAYTPSTKLGETAKRAAKSISAGS